VNVGGGKIAVGNPTVGIVPGGTFVLGLLGIPPMPTPPTTLVGKDGPVGVVAVVVDPTGAATGGPQVIFPPMSTAITDPCGTWTIVPSGSM
jgi:hypothetical protein